MTPAVSVIVTTYRHARFVEEALDSLAVQSFQDFEILLTDDASGDETPDIVESWLRRSGRAVSFQRNRANLGISANRKAALERAAGEFVCSLSGDDAYQPGRIEAHVGYLRDHPEVAAVYSDACLVSDQGSRIGDSFLAQHRPGGVPRDEHLFEDLLLAHNFLCAPAVTIRRSAIEAVDGYDQTLSYEDYAMWLKLAFRFPVRFKPGELVRYRVLETSMSHDPRYRSSMHEADFAIYKSWLGRTSHDAVLKEKLWSLCVAQLREGADTSARELFAAYARIDRRPKRALASALACVPFGCDALRFAERWT
jgi:glycosyltransferase involved in cell wall biosynthesis